MARLRVGTKRILATAETTKNWSRGGRKKLADRIRSERKAGYSMARSNYKYQGKQVMRTKNASYPHRPDPSHL